MDAAMDRTETVQLAENLCRATEWLEERNTGDADHLPRFIDAEHTWVDRRASIGAGTIVFPYCVIMGESSVGRSCVIFPHTILLNVQAGDEVTLGVPHQKNSQVGDECVIGSMAEFNRASFGRGSHAVHNSYLGDAALGAGSNVGAGFITANYDGKKKQRTSFGDGSFLGVNATVVAPNEFPDGTQIAAGSTIIANLKRARFIPPFSIIISRAKEIVIRARKLLV